ncbi:hypothetical protein GWK47_020089 [Chionoecetes opilio]|uniref:Uncharacterized protein n=1 Tax=Chionoecetes opilio TaxID=41210 RepID=A0A8J5CFE4_CHIOP|nr:hypothetical protein GWK47_020089 [Chionoecetes opilio]
MVSQLDDLLTHLGTGRWSVLHFIAMAYSSLAWPHTNPRGGIPGASLHYSCVCQQFSNADLSTSPTPPGKPLSRLSPSPSSSSSTSPSFISERGRHLTRDGEGQLKRRSQV